ncbi:serum basic protease inhibitor-like [Eubalaena glacialis]|uniref:serum basic protease inhibitor-like n=1 Tax=Eubalaena glacialis TaxID=27606 RepID=UPI002A5AE163|nr:serum basic protease inhibitor-like [Eubalaena glacialis]
MSQVSLSAALLVLLGTLLAGTRGVKPANRPRPDFCLEPPYTGPCKAKIIRYFYNAKSGFCETFLYGGCNAKNNNFKMGEDCVRTCGGAIRPWDKTVEPGTEETVHKYLRKE